MSLIYNYKIFLLFLGGVFSLVLTIAVIAAKQYYKRNLQRDRLEEEKRKSPETVGDITANLDDSHEFKKPDIAKELANWGIQPLLIISFVSLFDQTSVLEISIAFGLVILTLFHEFHFAQKFTDKTIYQLCILLLWVILFLILSYKANIKETEVSPSKKNDKAKTTNDLINPSPSIKV